jgi:hypothetical protein
MVMGNVGSIIHPIIIDDQLHPQLDRSWTGASFNGQQISKWRE